MADAPPLDPESGDEVTGVSDEATESPTDPFVVTLYFRNGLVREIEMTSVDYRAAHGRILDAVWEQKHAVPGDPLLAYLDWSQIQMVETSTIEPRARGRR